MRPSLTLAGLLVLGGIASARQQPLPTSRVHPITGVVRDAGTYHLATGTWTRKASQAHVGADIIYNNTCTSGYFAALSGSSFVDEGLLPNPSTPSNLNMRPGCATQYTVDGFQIAYCTDQLSMGTYTVNFYDIYISCASVIGVTPTAGFALTGLPGAAPLTAPCWIATIDLDSPPQSTSLAFVMQASPNGSHFGWEMKSSLSAATTVNTGPILAGDFNSCLGYDGTRWDLVVNYAEAGTGMFTQNLFRIEGGPTLPGCYFFSVVPMSSFHLELYADVCNPGTPPGVVFCPGDGTGTPCPCGNHSTLGNGEGCLHSLGIGGKLFASGTPSISNDTLILLGTQMPDASALYFQGTTQQNSGAGVVFGDGKRCAGGTTVRLKTVWNVGGASQYPQAGDPSVSVRGQITVPSIRTYQVWYRNAAAFCTPSTFNSTQGIEITWGA